MSIKTLGGKSFLLVFALTAMSCSDSMPLTPAPESKQTEAPTQPKKEGQKDEPKDEKKEEKKEEPKDQKKDDRQKEDKKEEGRITDLDSALKYGAMLVDVRTPREFATGSVPGAVNIPLSSIKDRLEEFKGKKGILVFCRSGNRSGQAKAILDEAGIPNVINGGTWQMVKAAKERLGL